jgi:hypothetical protein
VKLAIGWQKKKKIGRLGDFGLEKGHNGTKFGSK